MKAAVPASLRDRLSRLLLGLTLVWIGVVGVTLWAWLHHEVHELLDDSLRATAQALARVLQGAAPGLPAALPAGEAENPFAWQVVDARGVVLMRSANAPAAALAALPAGAAAGFVEGAKGWRIHAGPLPQARWLLVAQESSERLEALLEVAGGTISSALLVGLAGLAWLRWRLRRETQPLDDLATVLARFDPLGGASGRLPPPALRELAPVHEAVEQLGRRLAARVANEAAFNAHAAHALRTPLAGLDAQLAVAQREAPEPLRTRLTRMRQGTARLSHVVAALLALLRSGDQPRLQRVDVAALVARLPLAGIQVHVHGGPLVRADEDLLAAALINLLDNSVRHGAQQVWIEVDDARVEVRDDGPGADLQRLQQLRAALEGAAPQPAAAAGETHGTGLGLALAERVARAHGGKLEILTVQAGFAVALQLGSAGSVPRRELAMPESPPP